MRTQVGTLMCQRKLSARGLAVQTGLSYKTVLRHIKGETVMSLEEAVRYADVLGVSLDELAGRTRGGAR